MAQAMAAAAMAAMAQIAAIPRRRSERVKSTLNET
jgi:hypothetical protein